MLLTTCRGESRVSPNLLPLTCEASMLGIPVIREEASRAFSGMTALASDSPAGRTVFFALLLDDDDDTDDDDSESFVR